MTVWGDVCTNSPTVSRMFHAAPPPHQSRLRRASFPGGEAFVPCLRVAVLPERPGKAPKNLPHRGRGTARRRWMRGGTAFSIVGTTGAEVERSPICHSERTGSEPRNLPKWQVLLCGGTFLLRRRFLHSACAAVGMTYGGTCLVFIGNNSVLKRGGTAHRPFPTVSLVGGTVQHHGLYSQRPFCTVLWGRRVFETGTKLKNGTKMWAVVGDWSIRP